jgi:hypothetical protein
MLRDVLKCFNLSLKDFGKCFIVISSISSISMPTSHSGPLPPVFPGVAWTASLFDSGSGQCPNCCTI